MKFFYVPRTHLIARPQVDWVNVALLLTSEELGRWEHGDQASDGERLCEFMGRLCYRSFGERQGRVGAKEYLENIIGKGHGSVLEHANYSFVVTRAGRGFTHQWVRHRAGFAFSQESTHFIEYGGDARASLCGFDRLGEGAVLSAQAAVRQAMQAYQAALAGFKDEAEGFDKKKLRTGTARALLPNAIESMIGFTANARALRHACVLRGGADNTIEIRHVASQVAVIMKGEAPSIFGDLEVGQAADGFPVVSCPEGGRKV